MALSSMKGFACWAYIALRHPRQLMLALALTAASAASAQPSPVTEHPDVPYGPLPAEMADIYLPASPQAHRPGVVIIHGGGWVSGSRHAADYYANVLAGMGVVVMNIDYRLADKADPRTRWPAQLLDAQLAVRFLRAHATELGLDPARMGAVGDSSGAQLAVFLGVLPTDVGGDVASLYANQRPNVKAVVDQFGPMDIPSMGTYGIGSIDAMFGTITPPPADLLTTSPLPSVTSHSAPVYIIHGQADRVVPFASSQQLVSALRAHNVPVELTPYNGDHGYTGLNNDQVGKLQYNSILWLIAHLEH